MSVTLLALVGPATFTDLFEPLPTDWGVEIRPVRDSADTVRVLEGNDDCRLVLVERDVEPRLAPLVKRLRRTRPGLDIVLLTPAVSDTVRAELLTLGVELLDRGQPAAEIRDDLRRRLQRIDLQRRAGILGHSQRIHEIVESILQIGPTDIPVLITGPSGSGKELVARALYMVSPRRERDFVALNVGALAESVLESELFGHEKGAFTGAIARKPGVFERAHGGTLFLDEVGEMSPSMQVRLLRALESGEITPVGGSRSSHVDVRVIAATNRRLGEAVRHNEFREDLYYRLKVVHLELPSLAERREDLHELVQHFLTEAARQYGTQARSVSEGALRALQAHDWPGNVRELRNVVSRMAVMAQGSRIEERDVPPEIRHPTASTLLPVPTHHSPEQAEREIILQSLLALRRDLQEVLLLLRGRDVPSSAVILETDDDAVPPAQNLRQNEKEMIRSALHAVGGNRRLAAERLGIAERKLYRKLREYDLT